MRRHTCLGELPELLLLHGCLQLLAERRVAHDEIRVQPLEHGDLQGEASVRHDAQRTAQCVTGSVPDSRRRPRTSDRRSTRGCTWRAVLCGVSECATCRGRSGGIRARVHDGGRLPRSRGVGSPVDSRGQCK